MLHQFRFTLPLLPRDKDGLTPLHYYDSAIQIARNASEPLTEQEFELGMEAAKAIMQKQVFHTLNISKVITCISSLMLCLTDEGMGSEASLQPPVFA